MRKTPYARSPFSKGASKTQSAVPAAQLVRRDINTAAAVAKAVAVPDRHRGLGDQLTTGGVGRMLVQGVLADRAQRNADAASVMRMLPDIELAAQTWVSLILSPQDMVSCAAKVTAPEDIFNPTISAMLVEEIGKYLETEYNFSSLLPTILREYLFEKGSYPIAVIPENALDQFINQKKVPSTEQMDWFFGGGVPRTVGILNDTEKQLVLRVDNQDVASGLRVIDNTAILRRGAIEDLKIESDRETKRRTYAQESIALMNPNRGEFKLYDEIPSQASTARESIGKPLVKKYPSESVMPIHVPGDPEDHLAYIVAIDDMGNPVFQPDSELKHTQVSGDNQMQSALLQRAAANMGLESANAFDVKKSEHLRAMTSVYSQLAERQLVDRIKVGLGHSNFEISSNQAIYQLMLARALAGRFTNLLYIPKEYMTYFAFKYSDYGIGKSLIDDQLTVLTFRVVLLVTDILTAIRNSAGETNIALTVDENDPDWRRTVKEAQHAILESRSIVLPSNPQNMNDITAFVQKAAVNWSFKGHPGIPEMEITRDQVQTSYAKVDSELKDDLRKSSLMGFGLSPETIDASSETEFATTQVTQNVLLGKRVITHQERFEPLLSKHVRSLVRYDNSLIAKLMEIVEKDADAVIMAPEQKRQATTEKTPDETPRASAKEALRNFLGKLKMALPRPTSVSFENQLAEYTKYAGALDEVLNPVLSDWVVSENVAGKASEQADNLKQLYKAHLLRAWCAKNNFMPELTKLLAPVSDPTKLNETFEDMVRYTQDLSGNLVKLLHRFRKVVTAVDKDLESMGVDEPESTSSSSSSEGGDAGDGAADPFASPDLDFAENPDPTTADPADPATGDESGESETPKTGGDDSTTDAPDET